MLLHTHIQKRQPNPHAETPHAAHLGGPAAAHARQVVQEGAVLHGDLGEAGAAASGVGGAGLAAEHLQLRRRAAAAHAHSDDAADGADVLGGGIDARGVPHAQALHQSGGQGLQEQ